MAAEFSSQAGLASYRVRAYVTCETLDAACYVAAAMGRAGESVRVHVDPVEAPNHQDGSER
nr:hypothetical protein [Microbacterium bovistercoris]